MNRTAKLISIILSLTSVLIAQGVSADENKIRQNLSPILANTPIDSIKPSPIKGIYEVQLDDGQVLLADENGDYFIMGDVFQVSRGSVTNVSEKHRNMKRAVEIAAIAEKDMVVFAAENSQAIVTVFTDVDCGYCRKLHREVPELNKLGITVRYLAFPRAGIGSPSYQKIVSAWCAEDPPQALTDAKNGIKLDKAVCDNPVAKQYQLGQKIGITGTPALIFEDGTLVPGYIPAKKLADILMENKKS